MNFIPLKKDWVQTQTKIETLCDVDNLYSRIDEKYSTICDLLDFDGD